jgi:DNA-3-methyladenine glycosylase II
MTRQRARGPEEALRLADPVLRTVIDEVDGMSGTRPTLPPDPALSNDPNMPTDCYGVIIRGIASQNISAFASRAIYRKLIDRFGGRPPTPRQILDDDPDELRVAAGLSHAKTVSLRSLAEHILSGELQLDRLHDLPDEEVIKQLSAVKGIGTWTAEMFLIWHLNRPDILPVGDLGIRNGVRKVYGLPSAPAPVELRRVAEPWRPYRTLACLYLWRMEEATPQL